MIESPVMAYASDIQSFWAEPEVRFISGLSVGKIVLLVGGETGRVAVALASVSQRVHVVDDFGGDSPYGNTLIEFMKNLKRYRVLDQSVTHVGSMEKAVLAFDRSVFHVAVISGTKPLVMMDANASLFHAMVANHKCTLAVHTPSEDDYRLAAGFSTKPGFAIKKLSNCLHQIHYTRKGGE